MTTVSFPSTPPISPYLPSIPLPLQFTSEKSRFQRSYKQVIPRNSKKKKKMKRLPLPIWTRQSNGRKRVPTAGKVVRDALALPLWRVPQKQQANNHIIDTEDLGQTPGQLGLVFSLCVLIWVLLSWFSRVCFHGVVPIPSDSFPVLAGFLQLHYYISTHIKLKKCYFLFSIKI